MKLNRRSKLVFGVGINDANYNVYNYEIVNGKRKIVWTCIFYRTWKGILERVYDLKYKAKHTSYADCQVVDAWHKFSNFKAWMQSQDYSDKQIDKDILVVGNKIYGPDFCVFVSSRVNSFITESTAIRGEWPIGVTFNLREQKFKAYCNDVLTGKPKGLGTYTDPESAHAAWLHYKTRQANILAEMQTDVRVSKALIGRYENYQREG